MTEAFQFFADNFADALRLIGAGNSTAFLAAIVAFTYFPQKPEMADFLKRLSLSYLYGLGFFMLSCIFPGLPVRTNSKLLRQNPL
jgi:hypothetical protein